MKSALLLVAALILSSNLVHAQSRSHVRTIVAKIAESEGEAPNGHGAKITAQLADGAELELKSLVGGSLITIHLERGERIESSVQSISDVEAASLRELIENANQCPVELTFEQTQIVQAKPVCENR